MRDRGESTSRAPTPAVTDPGKEYRSTAGIPIVPSMDGFRALAILGIVVLHIQGVILLPGSEAARDALGTLGRDLVSVLFVLSGFVVFLPTVARGGRFGAIGPYAIRRGARLLPAYWLALAITFVLLPIWPGGGIELPSLTSLALNVSVLHAPSVMFHPEGAFFLFGFGVNGALWTLSLEITFYVLLPLIAAAYFRHPFRGLAIAAAIVIVWHQGFAHLSALTDFVGLDVSAARIASLQSASINEFPTFAFHFACGMTAAWAFVKLRERRSSDQLQALAPRLQSAALLSAVAFAALLAWAAASATSSPFPENLAARFGLLGYTASLGLFMLATALAPPRHQVPFSLPPVRRIGDFSYGIYLIHAPLVAFFLVLLAPTPNTLGGVLSLAVPSFALATLYGYLSARFVEIPIRRWAHRFGRRGEPSSTAETAADGQTASAPS